MQVRIFAVLGLGAGSKFYYPPEVRRGEYWGLGAFLLPYFPLVKKLNILHYDCMNMNIVA